MRTTRSIRAAAVSLTWGLLAAGTALHRAPAAEKPAPGPEARGALTTAEFDKLHARLTRMSTERVWAIPWQLSVREGRELAARENKPLFLWISNNGGTHPLGPC